MPTYRAYVLNRAGRITWGDWIEARDQREAEAKARELCREGAPAVEIWRGPKRVAAIRCGSDPAAAR